MKYKWPKFKNRHISSNAYELEVAFNFNKNGYSVMRGGLPDFLIYKINDKTIEIGFVEAKSENDWLKVNQKFIIAIFKYYNIPVSIIQKGKSKVVKFDEIDSQKLRKIYRQLFRTKI